LLGEEAWRGDYELAYPACLLQAECEFAGNNVDEAFRLLDAVSDHARSTLDRVAGLKLRTLILSHTDRLAEAIPSGLDAVLRPPPRPPAAPWARWWGPWARPSPSAAWGRCSPCRWRATRRRWRCSMCSTGSSRPPPSPTPRSWC